MGIIVYIAVPGSVDAAVNTCAIVLPVPELAPIRFVCTVVHVNVVPGSVLVSGTLLVSPEQIVTGTAVNTGL